MLESNRHSKLTQVLAALECRVRLPPGWENFFELRGARSATNDDRRQHARSHCPANALLQVQKTLPSVMRERRFYRVYTKDLSRSGISFLHEEQLYPGERVSLWFSSSLLHCTVVRCRRHNERCYEIGAKFGSRPPLSPLASRTAASQLHQPQ